MSDPSHKLLDPFDFGPCMEQRNRTLDTALGMGRALCSNEIQLKVYCPESYETNESHVFPDSSSYIVRCKDLCTLTSLLVGYIHVLLTAKVSNIHRVIIMDPEHNNKMADAYRP